MYSLQFSAIRCGVAVLGMVCAGGALQSSFAAVPEVPSLTTLSGNQEVPPVTSAARATTSIAVAADGAVTGTVETSAIEGTAAHLHQGSAGTNGPVLITLMKVSATQWAVSAGSRLTSVQTDSYRAGGLYANVHSAAHPNGEIRVQLQH